MATVLDLSGNSPVLDKTLVKQNRLVGADPNGSITPQFSGEIVLDFANKKLWQAQSLANNTWIECARITQG